MRTGTALATLLLAVGTPLAAQTRRPAFAEVVDLRGAAVGGAEVVLGHVPLAGARAIDVVRARADARGRAQPQLLPQRGYSAWAVATLADGETWISGLAEHVAAGAEVRFVLARRAPTAAVELRGADAWQAVTGPLHLRVAPPSIHEVFVPVPPDGALPPLPVDPVHGLVAAVCDAQGRELFRRAIVVTAAGCLVEMPPPRLRAVTVHAATGEAVASAVLGMQSIRVASPPAPMRSLFSPLRIPAWFELGRTDATGRAELLLPEVSPERAPPLVRADAAGRAPGLLDPGASALPSLVLGAPSSLQVLHAGPGTVFHGVATTYFAPMAKGLVPPPQFERLEPSPDHRWQLSIPWPPNEAVLVATNPDGVSAHLRLPLAPGKAVQQDWRWLRLARIQVRDAAGGPVRGLPLVISAHPGLPQHLRCVDPTYTDQAGRTTRWLGRDAWIVFGADARGFVHGSVRPGADAADLDLTLVPAVHKRIHCVEVVASAEPLSFETTNCVFTGVRAEDKELATLVEYANGLVHRILLPDAEQRFKVPWLRVPGIRLEGRIRRGAWTSPTFTMDDGDEEVTVRCGEPQVRTGG